MDSADQTARKSSSITIVAAGPPTSGGIVISPSVPPTVNQGATFQFTANATGTWSCSGTDSSGVSTACKGNINPMTGLYNAPATVAAQQSIGGYQLLPNNDIFNTRIDSLPINSNSASWITASGSTPVTYQQISKPLNYTNSSTDSRASCFSILRPITVRIRSSISRHVSNGSAN